MKQTVNNKAMVWIPSNSQHWYQYVNSGFQQLSLVSEYNSGLQQSLVSECNSDLQ